MLTKGKVFGPIVHNLSSLDSLNTSNERIRDFIQGKSKDTIPTTVMPLWTDVRDLALAHVIATELPDEKVGGKRFFVTAGYFTNKEIVDAIRSNYPEFVEKLPSKDLDEGGFLEGGFAKFDNSQVKDVLGIKFTSLEKSMVDLVKSLQDVGA